MFITSQKTIRRWWGGKADNEDYEAIERRIHEIHYFDKKYEAPPAISIDIPILEIESDNEMEVAHASQASGNGFD